MQLRSTGRSTRRGEHSCLLSGGQYETTPCLVLKSLSISAYPWMPAAPLETKLPLGQHQGSFWRREMWPFLIFPSLKRVIAWMRSVWTVLSDPCSLCPKEAQQVCLSYHQHPGPLCQFQPREVPAERCPDPHSRLCQALPAQGRLCWQPGVELRDGGCRWTGSSSQVARVCWGC